MVISTFIFNNFELTFPGAAKRLTEINRSELFPNPALIGYSQHMNKIRPNLWKRIGEAFQDSNSTAEGQELVRFWKFEKFYQTTDEYEELIREIKGNASIEEFFNPTTNR